MTATPKQIAAMRSLAAADRAYARAQRAAAEDAECRASKWDKEADEAELRLGKEARDVRVACLTRAAAVVFSRPGVAPPVADSKGAADGPTNAGPSPDGETR